MSSLPAGRRVLVSAFAESPGDALENHLRIEEQPAPDPAALRPDQVLIGVRSASIAWVDLLMTSGQYQHMPSPPYTPSLEYSGVVLAIGGEVGSVAVGDRVCVDFMAIGPRSYGDYQKEGGLATYVTAPEQAVLRIPGSLSFDQAAILLQAYETAYHCLIARGRLQPGETILINGASGLTGLASVQVAKLLGATVIATGRSDEKLAAVKDHGADHVVNICDADGGIREFRHDVKALTGGRGVDVVYDAVGGQTSLESMRCTAFDARFLIVGWTSTPDVARGKGQRGAPNANMLPTNIIQMKSLQVLGCPTVIAAAKDPAIRPARLRAIIDWAQAGQIKPFVSHVFPFEDYRQAMRARWTGEVTGGCIVRVSE